MTTSMRKKEMFFEKGDNAKVIYSFMRKAESMHLGNKVMDNRLKLSQKIIGYIERNPSEWDEKCQFNIKHIGKEFLNYLRDFVQTGQENINDIYYMSYRFLCEVDFFIGSGQKLDFDLSSIKHMIQSDNDEMSDFMRSQIIYASYIMPANMLKEFVNDPNIVAFQEFEQKKIDAENLKKKWDE